MPAGRKTGALSFAAAVIYVIVEYLRVQERYDALSGIPFGQIAGLLLIGTCWAEQRRFPIHSSTFRWIVVLLIWLLLVSLLSPIPSQSLVVWADVVKLAVLSIFTAAALDTRQRLYRYVIIVLLLYFLHTNFAFRGWVAAGFSVGFKGMWVGSGPLKNPNDFGAALAAFWGVSLAMIWIDRAGRVGKVPKRWLHMFNTLLFAVAVITSSSRGAAIALAVGGLYAGRRMGAFLKGLLVLVVFAGVYVVTATPEQIERFRGMGGEQDESAEARLETWKVAVEVFKDHPVLGVGLGVFPAVAAGYSESGIIFVQHNIYLQALTEAGIPGLLLVVAIILSFFRNHAQLRCPLDLRAQDPPLLPWMAFGLEVSMISFLVAGLFITVLFYPFMWVLLALSMASRELGVAPTSDVLRTPSRAVGRE